MLQNQKTVFITIGVKGIGFAYYKAYMSFFTTPEKLINEKFN